MQVVSESGREDLKTRLWKHIEETFGASPAQPQTGHTQEQVVLDTIADLLNYSQGLHDIRKVIAYLMDNLYCVQGLLPGRLW